MPQNCLKYFTETGASYYNLFVNEKIKNIYAQEVPMITKQLVADTIAALEDSVDALDDKEAQGRAQTLINFWRMYMMLVPEAQEEE